MKRFICLLLFLSLNAFIRLTAAQSDDITLPGKISPLFYLEEPFSETVISAENEELNIQVSSIYAENSRILVRFYVTGIPESWENRITDDKRLYGSYLPIAEIVTEAGTFLTPSSASRYSFLEFNFQTIIGGLLEFTTDTAPQAFYLNFNQVPFDTQPLQEGFTKAIILETAENRNFSGEDQSSEGSDGLEFTLKASAQTNSLTMLQPAIRMLRPDEELSKFGWISISASQSGKRYAVTRGNLYGFDLADDSEFTSAHSYVFSALTTDEPLLITMDRAYVIRSIRDPQHTKLSLADASDTVILRDEDIRISVSRAESVPEDERIRLYIDSGETAVSDIAFDFHGLNGTVQPQVSCGIDTSSEEFACDLYFYENAFPADRLEFDIEQIEYRKDGPWEVTWIPVPMEDGQKESRSQIFQETSGIYRQQEERIEYPDEVRTIMDAIEERNLFLTEQGNWIHERYAVNYQLSEDQARKLIPADQAEQYHTDYIQENLYLTKSSGSVREIISIVRDPKTDEILSAQWQKEYMILDLIHALKTNTEYPLSMQYSCFKDFSEIARSGAVFTDEESCNLDGRDLLCLQFYHSLNGMPNSRGSQSITFYTDPDTHYIFLEVIDYDLGALVLNKTTLALETAPELPEEILRLRDSFE